MRWYLLFFLIYLVPFFSDSQVPGRVGEVYPGFFKTDRFWKGADGASSIDLGNGQILWLFSDTFISTDSSGTRASSKLIRNSIAIQEGYHLDSASIRYYYNKSGKSPRAFFPGKRHHWFWTGHSVRVRNKLVIFLIEERKDHSGLGFRATGWQYVIVDNPADPPDSWKMKYVKGPPTFPVLAGSAAVLSDESFLYLYGVEEPETHSVYLLRISLDELLSGKRVHPQWWSEGQWVVNQKRAIQLFKGATEFSVHYDSILQKYIQVQTEGFGSANIIMRLSDRIEGPWSAPQVIYRPVITGQNQVVYTAHLHPELKPFLLISYNVNSLDSEELLNNEAIYYPRLIRIDLPGY